jgi:hypothetical protein
MATIKEKTMKNILLILVSIISTHGFAGNETLEAKKSLRALISPLIQKTSSGKTLNVKDFSVAKCEKHKIDWMNVLLMRETVALKFTFAPGCDIEGTVFPAVIKPFTTDLKLKNLELFNHLHSENKITGTIESQPILNIAVRSAKLSGTKDVVLFEADYQVRIDPLKKDDPIAENIGGEIRISEINGKKVSVKEKIKID